LVTQKSHLFGSLFQKFKQIRRKKTLLSNLYPFFKGLIGPDFTLKYGVFLLTLTVEMTSNRIESIHLLTAKHEK